MKIGDKVRFLSEQGGGIVSGFEGKDKVFVRDTDGFDIPVLIRECIVVESDNSNMTPNHLKEGSINSTPQSIEQKESKERPRLKPLERSGADRLNIFIAFVPIHPTKITTTSFETFFINDSNYFVDFLYLSAEDSNWSVRFRGTAEPNTKLFMEEFSHEDLNSMGHVCIQLIAYKEKSFVLKPAISVEMRLDGVKFFKAHCFSPSDFFEENALVVDVVRNDVEAHSAYTNDNTIKQELNKIRGYQHTSTVLTKKGSIQRDEPIVTDLHINQLLDNTSGLTAADILRYQLDTFRRIMNENVKHKGRKLIFIHGKGEGVLRAEILKELKHNYKTCVSQDASFREYGFGATQITIK